MTKSRQRLGGLFAALVLGLLTAIGGPQARPAAADDPAAECMRSGGIYLYILYEGSLVTQGCSTANNGYQRIKQVTSAEQTGGFVCRIAGLPAECIAPRPGLDIYWSYWWWRNGSWEYASQGGGYRGIPGTAEAWNYSAGQVPGIVPPDPQAAPPEQPKPEQPQPRQPEPRPEQPRQPESRPEQPRQPEARRDEPNQPAQTQPQTDQTTQATEDQTSPSSSSPEPTSSVTASQSRSSSPAATVMTPSVSPTPSSTAIAVEEGRGGSPWLTVGVLAVLAGAAGGYLLWRRRA